MNIYTRIMNPTCDALEQRVVALEGGVAALAVSSGQAASAMAIQNIARTGDNVVSSTDLYGGTWNLFVNTFREFGIEVRFVDPTDPESFRRATDDRTRAYYAETLPKQMATGVTDGYVRLSVGIEHMDDILADLDQALTTAGQVARAA